MWGVSNFSGRHNLAADSLFTQVKKHGSKQAGMVAEVTAGRLLKQETDYILNHNHDAMQRANKK